jgi:hypothetical protein
MGNAEYVKKCLRCNYQWRSIKAEPVCCPRCHSYHYQTPKQTEEKPNDQAKVGTQS